jgi:mono/diheme cytochrome c family protein
MATLTVVCSNLVVACLLLSLCPSTSAAAQSPLERGKAIYEDKCAVCHGEKGKGDGPVAASLPAKSTDFSDGKFWRGDATKLISNAIQKGKGIMPPITLEPGEIKDVTDYMTRTFKPAK